MIQSSKLNGCSEQLLKPEQEGEELRSPSTVWGYTMWIRVGVPGRRTAMAIPINYYGRQAGLPDE